MWDVHFFAAFVICASHQHVRPMFLPALLHDMQSPDMARHRMVLVKETLLEFADDGGEQNHLTPPHFISIPFTRLLMVWDVFFLVLDVR